MLALAILEWARVQRDTCHGDGWMRSRKVDWGSYCIGGSGYSVQASLDRS